MPRTAGFALSFESIPIGTGDRLVVPRGYVAEAIAPWGEPVGLAGRMPEWRDDASNTADDQAVQRSMHHDRLLHRDGVKTWSAEKVRKAQAAHRVSVIEIALRESRWSMVRPSPYARRFTAATPFAVGGPAAGHRLMRAAADPEGRSVLGTLNNCASGMTSWGTYLSGEEDFAGYFDGGEQRDAHQRRWGVPVRSGHRCAEHDERFDARHHPNEVNRFGWVVEIDPSDPTSVPVKRTALGRAVVYLGEDARFENIYKFVSRDRMAPGGAKASRELLDHGVLHVARFEADGTGH